MIIYTCNLFWNAQKNRYELGHIYYQNLVTGEEGDWPSWKDGDTQPGHTYFIYGGGPRNGECQFYKGEDK